MEEVDPKLQGLIQQVQIVIIIIIKVIIFVVVVTMISLMEYHSVFEAPFDIFKESSLNLLFLLKMEFQPRRQKEGDYVNSTILRI